MTADTVGGKQPAGNQSTGELVKQLSEQVTALVRDELKLAQLETVRKGKQAGLGAGMFGGSGLVALYGVACLLACAIIGLSHAVTAWLAALIVGAALLGLAGILALTGKRHLSKAVPPAPKEALDGIKTDVETIKEKAHS